LPPDDTIDNALFYRVNSPLKNQLFPTIFRRVAMKIKRIICVGMLLAAAPALSGCWYVVAGGAGAYGGYKMKEKGYTLRNPVAKEKSSMPPSK
jgi:hypothetical protein